MKLLKKIFLLFISVAFISSCEKDKTTANVLVTVKYNGAAVWRAAVYIEKGNDTTSTVPPAHFDYQRGADTVGQSYFENLQPDTYTIFAKGYSSQKGGTVKGKTTLTVSNRINQNEIDITVNTN